MSTDQVEICVIYIYITICPISDIRHKLQVLKWTLAALALGVPLVAKLELKESQWCKSTRVTWISLSESRIGQCVPVTPPQPDSRRGLDSSLGSFGFVNLRSKRGEGT